MRMSKNNQYRVDEIEEMHNSPNEFANDLSRKSMVSIRD